MIIVEFYDKNSIENICAGLVLQPDKIILMGDSLKVLKKQAENYSAILEGKGVKSEIAVKSVNKNNMQDIICLLSEIAEENSEVVFDLTGGDETYLTAAGIVFERYKDKGLQLHRVNIFNGKMQDCDLDGNVLKEKAPAMISIDENIRIYGGKILYENDMPQGTYIWDLSDEFKNDVNKMWGICRENAKAWNKQIDVFTAAEIVGSLSENGLTVSASVSDIQGYLKSEGGNYFLNSSIIKSLYKAGLIYIFADDNEFSITFKNEQVKRCLSKAGQILEMKVYISASEVSDKDCSPIYNDVMNGVYIDWDGEINEAEDGCDTGNEIDVIMMHGMIPVFVSCKNGRIDIDELYKLNTVAERFGGKYVKKVLIETSLGEGHFAQYFKDRAKEMNIRVVSNIQDDDDSEIARIIKSLWLN